MKDKNIILAQTPVYSPYSQCLGKKQYDLKRRAIKRAAEYSEDTGRDFHGVSMPALQ
jgi:hypothetical protein